MNDKLGVALSEANTWRGIIMLFMAVGIELDPEQQEAILKAGLALAGLIAVFFRRNPDSLPKS